MSDKQMEGDSQRRRALARQARERGQQPSEAGVTLGASKQFEHVEQARRDGPPPAAGVHKQPGAGTVRPAHPPPERQWKRSDPAASPPEPEMLTVRYRDLINEVGRRARLDFDRAHLDAEATVTVLARALNELDRQRLLVRTPTELHSRFAVNVPYHPVTLAGFLDDVSKITHRSPDQARYLAQTVLNVLLEQDHELIDSLDLPPDLRDLTNPAPQAGGAAAPTGHTPPLTDDELRAALTRLPYWSGTRRSLTRTISLPADNLERVMERLDGLKRELGRGPNISRPDRETALLVVQTTNADAVTALDVDLAHRVDAAIVEAGAGMASG
jgi:pterin-4a-carbinolamine dehydratase